MFCQCCTVMEYFRNVRTLVVDDAELSNPEFIRDVRNFARSLGISSYHWRGHLSDLYRDYHGVIIGGDGREVFLNMRVFEFDNARNWFRDFCCRPTKPHVTPYVRCEARGRAKILATILRAAYPEAAMMWGVRAVNDNEADDIPF